MLPTTCCLLSLLVLTMFGSFRAEAGPVFTGTVLRVVDGDTIYVTVDGRTEKVRYIGMDAPETHHPTKGKQPGGPEVTAVNRRLVENKEVRLELDVQQRDRYRRLLAYVYVGDLMVNAEMLRLGYAQLMTVPPNVQYTSLFVRLQRDAREAGRGLWGRPTLHARD